MLVKLGDVWVDPARVTRIEPNNLAPVLKSKEGDFYETPSIDIGLQENDRIVIKNCHKEEADLFASIVNEALAPKQSWSEEISEPEK